MTAGSWTTAGTAARTARRASGGGTRRVLHGRDVELAALDTLVGSTPAGGAALLVLGEPGIGKSMLLRAAAERAHELGYLVLETLGVEAETEFPFGGLHQLLRPLSGQLDTLPPAQRHALNSALGLESGATPEPVLIALGALTLLTRAAEAQPVLVVADDVQWLDAPTNAALAYIARRVGSAALLVVGASRPGARTPFTSGGLSELVVTGLTHDDAGLVLDQHGPDLTPAERDRVLAESQGNPLALVELPNAVRAEQADAGHLLPVTARLEHAFWGRVRELPAAERDVLLVAATVNGSDLDEILAAAGVLRGTPTSDSSLDLAVAARLVVVDGRRVTFRHPLVRSGILAVEGLGRRQRAHAAIARALTDDPYRRTWHQAMSIIGPDADIADALERNAATSMARGAVLTAITELERSAELTGPSPRRGRRLLRAAQHAFSLGRADLVSRLATTAALDDLDELDRARLEWLSEIFHDGVPGDAIRVLELCNVAQTAAASGDLELALDLLLGAALRCWWADTGPQARSRVREVTRSLHVSDTDPRFIAALAVAEPVAEADAVMALLDRHPLRDVNCWPPGSPSHEDAPAAEAVGLPRCPDVAGVSSADSLRMLGMSAHAVGDTVRAVDLLERAALLLRSQGRLGLLLHVRGMQNHSRLELGEVALAAEGAREARAAAEQTEQPIWSTGTVVTDARAAALRGESDLALQLAANASRLAGNQNCHLACAQLAIGLAHLGAGRHREAYEALSRMFDPDDPSYHWRERFAGITPLADSARAAGRLRDARRLLAHLETVGEVTAAPLLHVHLRHARAVLAEPDVAEALYLTAMSADLGRWPLARANLQLAYGLWLQEQKRPVDAADVLPAAAAFFESIGARPWAQAARNGRRAAEPPPEAAT